MGMNTADFVAQLAEQYDRLVFTTAYKILGNAEDAEDVLQGVFLKLLSHRNNHWNYGSVENWAAYLRAAATNSAIQILRQRSKEPRQNTESYPDPPTKPTQSPRSHAIRREKANLLRQALAELPERDGEIFVLRYFEDYSYQEISEKMNISVNAVGVVLHRSRERLKEILQPCLSQDRINRDSGRGE